MVLLKQNDFLDNPFKSRQDVEKGLVALLDPLEPHTSPGGALITLGTSGTHYDLLACQLESFSRPLWGLVSLISGGSTYSRTSTWSRGLAAGTDPEGDEYWGGSKGKDQRMVEMSAIGFALAMAPKEFLEPLDERARSNIAAWLGAINDKQMPDTNWLWFRVFANLALSKISPDKHFNTTRMKADLDHLDTFQLRGEESGWSRDGPEGVRQLDYYSGSFAIQFAQLVYSKLENENDPERAENYRKRALRFALDFIYYFDESGRCIPFGRSMIYRFAVISTFSVLPFAFPGELPEDFPLKWGHIKGLVLRHLRWWGTQENIFKSDGTLNIGYCYENMSMTENYNGFGSPYWCTKAFACLSVPQSHPFWQSEELPWPKDLSSPVQSLVDPLHIMVRVPPSSPKLATHTYLLSSGQACHYALKAAESKYGRFSYSSAFGFSCPTGAFGLEQQAADSMLALCDDPEDEGFGQGERWRVRRIAGGAELVEHGQEADQVHLRSTWRPWPDVEVETWLFPPTLEAPCWYLRVHRLKTGRKLRSSEGSWPLYGQGPDGRALVQVFSGERSEGGLEETGLVRAETSAGVVGAAEVSLKGEAVASQRSGEIVQADANSNLIYSRSVLPSLKGSHEAGSETWFATGIFAVPAKVGEPSVDSAWKEEWSKRPKVPEVIAKLL